MIVKQLQGDISLVTEQHENNSKFSNKILVKKKGKEFIIGLDQVSRIESGGNYVYIHSNNNVYPMRSTMAKMTEKLNNTVFVRIHRSYIVNTDYIKEIITITPQEYQIMMTDGAMIPLSRKNRPLLLARFHS
jgi:DNA-binding LytR/AlgR family response regulator